MHALKQARTGNSRRLSSPPAHLSLSEDQCPHEQQTKRMEHLFSCRKHFRTWARSAANSVCGSNMRKPGKGSEERDAYYFWNDYIDDQDKHFFKFLIGDFHKRLVLPDKLALHFRAKTTKGVKLESRSGHTFDVQVANNLGKLALQSGWELFVSAHDLQMLDFLVFKYDGISRMKVLIFDASGCEKVLPCFVTKNAISGRQRKEEPIDISSNYANISIETPETKKKAWKRSAGSNITNISSSSSPLVSSGGSISEEELEVHCVPSYILPQGTSLTNVQKKKLKDKVRSIGSEIPIYVCVMKKTNVSRKYGSMDFSGKYAGVYLPLEDNTLMLNRHGKSWKVMCRTQVPGGQRKFKRVCKGWGRFASDNNLRLGDLCLFELLKTKKYTMNVHIVREK